jgi:phospholipid-binding lipoprotein MlaA
MTLRGHEHAGRGRARGRAAARSAALALALMLVAAGAARAQPGEHGPLAPIVRAAATVTMPVAPPAAPRESLGDTLGRWGTSANQVMYGVNAWLLEGWTAIVPPGPPSPAGIAVANLFANWINEPLTMASYAAVGRFDDAGVSGRRFLVNTFRGWGGTRDVATERGLVVPRIDVGLALCALGTPAGPYVVLPIVGPRTLRDGLADIVAVNGLTYLALSPLGLPTGVVIAILVADEFIHLAIMRQIDSVPAEEIASRDFDAVRAGYLAERAERCGDLRGARPAHPAQS